MHQLRTLGTLELTSSGVPATSLLAQPRRTALFCYLALARPVGFKNRETLFALFWPEQEAESARHALRQSLYFLRRSLGSEILIARGDESVAVNPELLSCDLWAFDQSIRERRYAQAIELYEGELLPGFFISYAPGFERWLEDERARVHRSAIDAAWTLAEEAETAGEPDLALSWARRAAEMAPYDEAACRRLMLLLESQGERVAALRAFESFAALVQREHGFAPEEETLQLVERIRLPRRSRESDAGTDSSDGQEKGERESEAVEVPASTATPIQSADSSADDRRVAPPRRGIARSLRYGSAALLVAVMVAI